MDASVSLMNQYSVISARFPPPTLLTQTQQSSNSTAQSATSQTSSTGSSTTNNNTNVAPPGVATSLLNTKLQKDLGSTAAVIDPDKTSGISTIGDTASSSSTIDEKSTLKTRGLDENLVTIEDIDSEESNEPDAASELRRRRLQKFLKTEQDP